MSGGTLTMVRRFLPYLRPVRARLIVGLLVGLPAALLQWLAPWPLKLIFDNVIGHQSLPAWLASMPSSRVERLDILVAAMVAIALGQGIASFFAARLLAEAGQSVVLHVRRDLFRHLEAQSLGFHQKSLTGDLMSRLGGDTQALRDVLVTAVPILVNNTVTLLGMLTILLVLDWHYTLMAVALWPVLYVAIRYFLPNIKEAQRQARRWEGQANSVAEEVLRSLAVVQAFGREREESDRFEQVVARGLAANQRAVVLQSAFTPTTSIVMTAATGAVVWFAVRSILTGQLTAGDLIVFMAYFRGMYAPVRQLAKLANVVSRGQAGTERIAEILDTRDQVPERSDARTLSTVHGAVSFEHVSLAYANGQMALTDVSLDVAAGTRIAIIGATGSGKSTLLRLLPRFTDPTSGRVLLDGVDLRDLSLSHLREQIALVPQEAYVFRASVWENIAFGGANLQRQAAIAAAQAAGVYDVLANLSNGFDTVITERGASLSGGQRQCLSLARAMARNPKLLLLDEPTTGLDIQLQTLLMRALARLSEGRTTFLISHDLSTVRDVDLVVVLEGGRIVACAAPERVLAAFDGRVPRSGQGAVVAAQSVAGFSRRLT